jgi:hypothetical protein
LQRKYLLKKKIATDVSEETPPDKAVVPDRIDQSSLQEEFNKNADPKTEAPDNEPDALIKQEMVAPSVIKKINDQANIYASNKVHPLPKEEFPVEKATEPLIMAKEESNMASLLLNKDAYATVTIKCDAAEKGKEENGLPDDFAAVSFMNSAEKGTPTGEVAPHMTEQGEVAGVITNAERVIVAAVKEAKEQDPVEEMANAALEDAEKATFTAAKEAEQQEARKAEDEV